MNRLLPLLMVWGGLVSGCVSANLPVPQAGTAYDGPGIHSIAIAPVAYATYQPAERCSTFIDEDLRSALARELRRHGYAASSFGSSVPRSFSAGNSPPPAGAPPAPGEELAPEGSGVLRVWIDEYFENTLCGWEGPRYLTIGAVGVLYAGSPPREVWRAQARAEDHGYRPSGEMIWITTSRVAEQLLQSLPGGSGGEESR